MTVAIYNFAATLRLLIVNKHEERSMPGTVSTQDQTFVTEDGQMNVAEIETGLLAEANSGNVATAELGRWFATQHTFLQAVLNAVGSATGATVPSVPSAMDAATYQTLQTLSGSGFDSVYLPAEIASHATNLAAHVTEAATGSNALIVQVAAAETAIVQNHLYEAELLNQQEFGGPAPTVSLITSFVAPPPLAAEQPLNATDTAFVTAATYAAMTAVQEGVLAQTQSGAASVQNYGNWNITNDGPLMAAVAALAAAGGVTPPSTLDAADAAQVATLAALTGSAFDIQYAAYGVANYQAVLATLSTEVAGGSDPALVALAKVAIPTAQELLAQDLIEYGEATNGLTDTTAAPGTAAGAVLNAFASAEASGTALIGTASLNDAPAFAAGATGLFIADTATAFVPTDYTDVMDTSIAPATVVGAASGSDLVLGSDMSFFGGASASGEVVFAGGTNAMIGAGSGNWDVLAASGNNDVFAGAGNDTIAVGTGSNTVGLGSGHNIVVSTGDDTIVGSSGQDVIFGQSGTQAVFAGSQGVAFVGGSGQSSIIASAGAATVFGSNGNSTALFGSASDVLVAGAGNETLQAGNTTGANVLFGGSGDGVLVGGSGTNFFDAGNGNNVMIGGAGPDIFQFVSGAAGGNDAIYNLSSGDKILLTGYGANEMQQALSGAQTAGGSTTLTLSDNTHITLVGIGSIGAGSFA